jgi:hypothetical protein
VQVVRIEIEAVGLRERGLRYRVMYAGAVLIKSTRNPEFDACRALLALGITGRLEVWRPGKAHHDLQLDIAKGAGLTVRETEEEGPYIARWRPYSGARRPDALLYRGGQAPAAILDPAGPYPARTSGPKFSAAPR